MMEPSALAAYARICGWTLAKAHARSGDAVAISAYLGSSDAFDRAMASFAEDYADQNERDYAAFRDAVGSGPLAAIPGLGRRRHQGRDGMPIQQRTEAQPPPANGAGDAA